MPEHSRSTGAIVRDRLSASDADDKAESIRALDAHAGLIIASAARVLGNLTDAEDVAQDIAEKLLKSPPCGIGSWPAYLRTLAVNRAVDQLRGRRRRAAPGLEDREPGGDPEAAAYDEQRAEILRRAISGLPVRDAQLFSLYYFGDLSHGDIAAHLKMTANAVGVALYRIRARLTADVSASLDSADGDQTR